MVGVRFPSGGSSAIVNVTLTNGAEVVVCTTPPLIISQDFAQIMLVWYIAAQAGNTTTTYTARLRRGTTAGGTLVNVATAIPCTGNAIFEASGAYVDTPGAVSAQQYSLTITNAGGSGNGLVNDVSLLAFAL